MAAYLCPYLKSEVELTDERKAHIMLRHPELSDGEKYIAQVLASPTEIRRSSRFHNARLFSRSFTDFMNGKYVVVVVVTDSGAASRSWVITAYVARKLCEGEIEWKEN